MQKSILVTGGYGFIGSHTVVELAKAGYRPVIVDNFSNSELWIVDRINKLAGKQITLYEGDYQDKSLLEKIFKAQKIAGVIHFAAYKAVGESVEQPLKYYDNNVSGFVDLLDFLTKKAVNNFVFSSSAAVYGEPPATLVTEETACRPTSPYGWSKYMDEIILKNTCTATKHLKGVALRYFNVVGAHPEAKIGELPKGKPQNLLPIVVQACAKKIPPLTIFGDDYQTPDGTCQRDYVHVVDLARAHVSALDYALHQRKGLFEIYNIGTGKPTSVLELIKTFEKINNIKVPYKIGARRPGDPAAYYAEAKKAKKHLNWQSELTIENACADAWRWQKTLN
ncbi:MAG TPA: UDP-glucose 4-epimerase GalE [Candidatus Saccharimonadales bacterium]|nr:UDP-glucose 4-epimerase GalE [Candidatus Saccharimonadales bacterium]